MDGHDADRLAVGGIQHARLVFRARREQRRKLAGRTRRANQAAFLELSHHTQGFEDVGNRRHALSAFLLQARKPA